MACNPAILVEAKQGGIQRAFATNPWTENKRLGFLHCLWKTLGHELNDFSVDKLWNRTQKNEHTTVHTVKTCQ
jgi:hypothetical protein